jgi:hypothetical protein
LLLGALGGGALSLALSGCFSAPPQIVSLEPNRGSTSVPADAPVQVVFDRPVAHASVAARFSVTPSIPGCDFHTVFAAPSTAPCWIHWLPDQPGFELLHEEAVFAPAKRYTFTLAGGFEDPQGDRNDLDHHWDLTTAAAPAVASTTPAARSSGVPIDASLAVSFNSPMDAPSTAAAISLDPVVPGTRVVRNAADHSRFVILPGQLLDPGLAYTISVSIAARGEDQQALFAPVAVHFTTGGRLLKTHAVVLAGVPGEGATEVLLPSLDPGAPGEPPAAPMVLDAPRCQVIQGCGRVPLQSPLQTYAAAAIAPDGAHLAVVVVDAATSATALDVVDVVDDVVLADVPGGAQPSWSPDGAHLAFATSAGVGVFDVRSQSLSTAAAATAVVAPPMWSSNTTLVISTAAGLGTAGPVSLLNRALDARYDLPGVPPGSTVAAVSPSGTRIALATADGGILVVALAGAPGGTQRLTGRLTAIGFTGDGILLAVSESGGTGQLVRISVGGGDSTGVSLPGTPNLQSVRLAPDGRRLVCLGVDGSGVLQAYVAGADGSGQLAITRFLPGGLQAQAVNFSA